MIPVPGVTIEGQPETVILRMCVWAEARGEGPYGMLAVLWAIKNRALHKRMCLKDVVLKPLWFSAFNKSDPNRDKLLTAFKDDPVNWAVADAVVEIFEKGRTLDPTYGSTHYYNFKTANPVWGRGHSDWQERITIKNHVFGECP